MKVKEYDDFLKNPVQIGVFKLIIDFKEDPLIKIKKIYRSLVKDEEEIENENFKSFLLLLREINYLGYPKEKFKKEIGKGTEIKMRNTLKSLDLVFDEIKVEAHKLNLECEPINQFHNKLKWDDRTIRIWKYLYFKKYNDVLSCDLVEFGDNTVRVIFYSLKPKLLDAIREILIKILEKFDVTFKKTIKTHKYEEVISIYPSVLALSLSEKDSSEFGLVIDDLDYALEHFYDSARCRVCAIFAGIALEEQIVAIYENEIKKRAPDIPIGPLLEKLKCESKNFTIPDFIRFEIKQSLGIRNTSVHRGPKVMGVQDAIRSLIAPTMLFIWYSREKGVLK